MEKILEFVSDGIEYLLLLILITATTYAFSHMRNIGNVASIQENKNNTVITSNRYLQYNNTQVKGVEVINAINLINKRIAHSNYSVIVTNGSIVKTYTLPSDYTAVKEADTGYIYPNDKYTCVIEYNTNKSIKNIKFTKV